MLRLPESRGVPVSTDAAPPTAAISYVEYLQNRIEDARRGVVTICGPPVADYPTPGDRIWPFARPNHEIEAQLEAQLAELETQLEI